MSVGALARGSAGPWLLIGELRVRREAMARGGMILLLCFYYRNFIFFGVNELLARVPYVPFYRVTTFVGLLVAAAMYLVNQRVARRVDGVDLLLLFFGAVFFCLAIAQRALIGAVVAVQVFAVPILVRGIASADTHFVRRVLRLMALGSALFIIAEFVVVNNHWLHALPVEMDFGRWFDAFLWRYSPTDSQVRPRLGLVASGVCSTGNACSQIVRPLGAQTSHLNSSVPLAMLGAFFVVEAIIVRRVGSALIAALTVVAVLLSTSMTALVALMLAVGLTMVVARRGGGVGRRWKLLWLLLVAAPVVVFGRPVYESMYASKMQAFATTNYYESFLPNLRKPSNLLRYAVGGNAWEYTVRHTPEVSKPGAGQVWHYRGQTLLIRESNLLTFVALFGIVPTTLLMWRWLLPLRRLWRRSWLTDPAGVPHVAAFTAGLFTLVVHDNGILFWQNTFLFFVYYEFALQHQRRRRCQADTVGRR